MSHTVAVGEFEGPLGVLLDLVERGNLEVSQVSVGQITADYLEHIGGLSGVSAEELSDFLQLGARLLYIKSLALLPQSGSEDEQARELAQLNLELTEYRRFQAAAKELAARGAARTFGRPAPPRRIAASAAPPPGVSLDRLAEAFVRALKFAPPAAPSGVIKHHLGLETVLGGLRERLPAGFELHTVIERCRDRLEIVVTFLAVLELVRSGEARATQTGQFEAIRIEAARD